MVHSGRGRNGLVLVWLLIVALALAAPAGAAVVTIDASGSGPLDINNISDAISAAGAGGTVILNPGTYYASGISFSTSVRIQANTSHSHTAADTIIDGTSSGNSIFDINGRTVAFDNLTLQNGRATSGGAIYNSGGVFNLASVTFTDCTADGGNGGAIFNDNYGKITGIISGNFTGCTATGNGGAIFNDGAIMEANITAITSTNFTGCRADNYGGAIYNSESVIQSINSGTFTGCVATYGDGGAIFNAGTNGKIPSIASSIFSGCTAGNNGGAIENYHGTISSIASGTFSGCTAGNLGGALHYEQGTIPAIDSSSFTGCTAGTYGSAIYDAAGGSTIRFSRFYGNSAPSVVCDPFLCSSSTAAYNWWGTNSDPSPQIDGSVTTSPWLVLNASAVPSSITTSQTSAIRMNLTNASDGTAIADTTGGGIFVPDIVPVAYTLGGVTGSLAPEQGNVTTGANTTTFDPSSAGTALITVTVDGQSVTVPVTVTAACSNTVTLNAGDSIAGNVPGVCDGGTLILNPGTYKENGITLSKSITLRAADGYGPEDVTINGMQGGSSILTVSGGHTVVVDNLTLYNSTDDFGGGIYNSGNLFVNSTTFRNCNATFSGGAIANMAGNLAIASGIFTGCSADTGGAIYNGATLSSLTSGTFTGCSATTTGGAIDNPGTITTLTSSTFTGCSANAGGAIDNSGTIATISSSTFTGCSADSGGAIDNTASGYIDDIHFCRFFGNAVVSSGPAIFDPFENVQSATNNWWGTNSGPGGYTVGVHTKSPWLVLNASAVPLSISTSQFSAIRMNLTNNSAGDDTSTLGHVPDGIPVAYSFSGVSGSLAPEQGNVTTGANATTFDPSSAGTALITATVDGQSVTVPVTVIQVPQSMTANSGTTPQSAVVSTAFGTNLSVTVTDAGGDPVPGVSVTFAAPSSGASGTFSGGTTTITTTTNSTGVATAGFFTANSNLGPYTVTAAVAGLTQVTFSLTNTDSTCSDTVTISPGDSVAGGVSDTCDGGTLILNPGTYNEYGIAVAKDITIQANTSYGGTAADTIIDGMKGGSSILTTGSGSAVTLDNLTLYNGTGTNGGAISAGGSGSVTSITSSRFTGCTATGNGGAIYNPGGTLSVTASAFSGCTATVYGGAIYNLGTITTLTSSTFTGCSATVFGGAIDNDGTITTLTSSTFTGCSAAAGGAIYNNLGIITTLTSSTFTGCSATLYGGAIRNDPSFIVRSVHFCRFFGNTAPPGEGPAIVDYSPFLSAENNWWGTNSSPSADLAGVSTYDPWLRLNAIPSAATVTAGTPVTVTANLTFNSIPGDTSALGHVPDGIPVAYSFSGVTGSLDISQGNITTGANATTFTPTSAGTALITVTVDGESVTVPVTVATPATVNTPAVYATLDERDNDDGFPSVTPTTTQADTLPLMTVTVNIGGDSKAWQAVVTGTKLTDLIVTGTVQAGDGGNATALPPGTVFQYLSLVPARYTSITKAVIRFTVPEAWLEENHIDKKSIVLYHYTANGWEALPTTMVETKDGNVYFSAETTGFSLFAIAGTLGSTAPAAASAPVATFGSAADGQEPARTSAVTKAPVTAETTAPAPAEKTPAKSSPFPVVPVLAVLCCAGLIGGGWYVRRWWIRRQNPALFREYD